MKFVLITGCSSGIGLSSACHLKSKGYEVIASSRKQKDLNELKKNFKFVVMMDTKSSNSIKQACRKIKTILNGRPLYAIFCNAGYGQFGSLLDVKRRYIRDQFETNLFGHIELIQHFLPTMLKQNQGRILFNSSVLGFVSLPFRGAYNASKFAMEGIAQALRLELDQTNIKVSVINPGPIEAKFNPNALRKMKNINKKSIFQKRHDRMKGYLRKGKSGFTYPAIAVAKKVEHAISSSSPKRNYYVTKATYYLAFLQWLLPKSIFEKILIQIDRNS